MGKRGRDELGNGHRCETIQRESATDEHQFYYFLDFKGDRIADDRTRGGSLAELLDYRSPARSEHSRRRFYTHSIFFFLLGWALILGTMTFARLLSPNVNPLIVIPVFGALIAGGCCFVIGLITGIWHMEAENTTRIWWWTSLLGMILNIVIVLGFLLFFCICLTTMYPIPELV
jgi:hypothetical protein